MISGAEKLNNFIEQYKTNRRDAIDNMKNYYDNEDEYWWIIQELLDKNIESEQENQRLNNVLNELEKIIQTDTEIYFCSESAMKSFKSAETIYRSYLLNKLKELKESDK